MTGGTMTQQPPTAPEAHSIPAYEADDGPVPDIVIAYIRASVDQTIEGGTSLFEIPD